MVVNSWRRWLFPNSTASSRVINSLFIIKAYLIRHAFGIPAKLSFCWLKVWITINDSQPQSVFPKHRMMSLKFQLFIWWQRLYVWWLCWMFTWKTMSITWFQPRFRIWIDSNSDYDTSCLVSFYRWETLDKHHTKIRISEPFDEATERFKESFVSLKRHIY